MSPDASRDMGERNNSKGLLAENIIILIRKIHDHFCEDISMSIEFVNSGLQWLLSILFHAAPTVFYSIFLQRCGMLGPQSSYLQLR